MSYIAEIMAQPYLLTRSFAGRQFTTLPGEAPVSTPVVVPQPSTAPVAFTLEVVYGQLPLAASVIPELLQKIEFQLSRNIGGDMRLRMRRRIAFGQQSAALGQLQIVGYDAVFPPGTPINFGGAVFGLTNVVVRKRFSKMDLSRVFGELNWVEVS